MDKKEKVDFSELLIVSGSANRPLSEKIAERLSVKLGQLVIKRFSDGEIDVQFLDNVRKKHVFIIQPTFPPGDNLLELLIAIDAANRASADEITAVIPYFGYGRQDRKDRPRVAITARLVATLLEAAGVHRVLTIDFHSSQEQGFFVQPVDHLFAGPLITDRFREYFEQTLGLNVAREVVVVAPDAGAKLATKLAGRLGCKVAMLIKERVDDKRVRVVGHVGSVEKKHALIMDDIISTAGTLVGDTEYLMTDESRRRAKAVYVGATHPVFAGDAFGRIKEAGVKKVIVANTIPYRHKAEMPDFLEYVDISNLLANAIRSIYTGGSVSRHCFGISV